MPLVHPDTGIVFARNAGLWFPLASSAVVTSNTGVVTEVTHVTATVPAGALGANGRVEIEAYWTITNSANIKNCRIYWNGTGGTNITSTNYTTTAVVWQKVVIQNKNSASSQHYRSQTTSATGTAMAAAGAATASVNTANAVDIVLASQLANSGETISLLDYDIKVLYKA